ncbi:LuxR C-terminal-related transcriptional regulator [Kribbella sp. VKM Ac-2568]|uniref:ATP-binding protein n=1 Tax=Kribbella sp. VKM Ac-2568 TaxID=2512219 RepID=UPI001049827D|nr:LuxR C-terminal-related transcriptional regulator [Kribbella sp. VKM Ac-2568]TCM50256.1 putative ATPase [Kribbella sp. VKM Ac-2568]
MTTLPAELTSFVGRRQELLEVRALLATSRLVTLTGPGGVGKTRLALRTAVRVQRTFPDGVWLVELAAVHDPGLLAKTIGMTLGLRDADEDPAARLTEYLGDRSLLLVLDNCEHLAEACAVLIGRLLPAAPGIRVLATSRHVLGVEGEHVYSVQPLVVGEVRDLADAHERDVVRLFADRAVATSAGFTVDEQNWSQVVEVCRRLDGIPLAVELAAAWLRVLSVDALLDRLDKVLAPGSRSSPARHTLAATIDWSHALCTPAERTLWARLSVFAGGFDLAAAEEVCSGRDVAPLDVLELLANLVDKSIVQSEQGTARFHLLETIRQYGLRRLREAGEEDAVRARHRDHYLRLAEGWSRDWRRSTAQTKTYAQARQEHANLRAALQFSLGSPDQVAIGLRLVVALHFQWLFCGHPAEGRLWLEQALELNPEPSRDRAAALGITAYALSLMGYASSTYSHAQEADAWARKHQDEDMLGHTKFLLGSYYFLTGEIEKSAPLFEESIRRLEGLGEPSSFVLMLYSAVAQAELWQGHLAEGMALARRALGRCDDTGEQFARRSLLFAAALADWMQGNHDEAVKGLTQAIRLAQAFNDVLGAINSLELLCWTTAASGRHERAAELLGVANKVWSLVGGHRLLGSLKMIDAHDACERDVLNALGSSRYQAAFDRGTAASVEFHQAMVYAVGREADADGAVAPARPGRGSLSEREYEVAELVAQGLTNKEIALRLVISRRTAESHVVHILDKLGFNSRSQIATWLTSRRYDAR